MIAIILAGGRGSRLRPLVSDRPKPMALIDGQPFLYYLLSYLSFLKFEKVVISIGYFGDQIIDYFGDEFNGMQITYELENHPLGTGGAVKTSLKHCGDSSVFILNGDTFFQFEPSKMQALGDDVSCKVVIACCQVSETTRFGKLRISNDTITEFGEKGSKGPGVINAGCYLLRTSALEKFQSGEPFSLEQDFFEKEVDKGSLKAAIFPSVFIDIGIPDDYLKLQQNADILSDFR